MVPARTPVVRVLVALAVTFAALASARADAVPEGVRVLRYRMTIANLADYSERWAFILSPTSNSGFGYVLEEGVGLSRLMMRARRGGLGSRLHAMRRADLEAHAGGVERHPHGDDNAMVRVVPAPPSPPRALMASADISPPAPVREPTSRAAVERTYRITTLTSERFELELVTELIIHDGGRIERVVSR